LCVQLAVHDEFQSLLVNGAQLKSC